MTDLSTLSVDMCRRTPAMILPRISRSESIQHRNPQRGPRLGKCGLILRRQRALVDILAVFLSPSLMCVLNGNHKTYPGSLRVPFIPGTRFASHIKSIYTEKLRFGGVIRYMEGGRARPRWTRPDCVGLAQIHHVLEMKSVLVNTVIKT